MLSAQTPLTLQEAVATAIRQHPVLQASEQRIRVAEGFRRQAGLMLNPRLVLQTENTRPYGPFVWLRDTDNFAYLQQTFETGGKRERRVELASAGQRRAELERELIERQIANRVKQAYWQAAGAQLALRLLDQDVARFDEIIRYHQARVTEGAIAEVDLIRVRVEGGRVAVSRNAASLDAERARIAMQREMAAVEFPDLTFTSPLEPLPEVPVLNVSEILDQRPEVRIARQMVDQARANLRLQQAQSKPNVDALFGYKRATGFDSMLGGVQVDLPFANRNQGNISAAVSEIRAAESSLAATEALVRAEVEAARREVEIRRQQLGGQLRAMREQAAEAARIAEASYREGATDLLRFLDAQRLRIETQLLYTRTLAEYRQSYAVLEAAMGVAP
ncbi:MAG: TolC family protein [Bryobacterales bacterium]|nr:TolC family protein [Bryobacterales bacterium]